MRVASALLLVCLGCAACDESSGTIVVDVVTAPGDQPLANAARVRLTLSDPPTAVEADRNADGGFALTLEVDANGEAGFLDFEAFDTAGDVVAVGGTPFLPIAAVDASVTIFVAPPDSFRASPVALPFSGFGSAVAPLPFGALIAGGGFDGDAEPDDIVVYNAFSHELQVGIDLPRPLVGMAGAAGANGVVYLFGGFDGADNVGTAFRFDTNVAPAGELLELEVEPGLERSFEDMVPLGGNRFLITGDPTAVLDAGTLRVSEANVPPSLAPAVSVTADNGAATVVVTLPDGRPGIVGTSDIAPLDVATPRTGHVAVELADERVLWVGGRSGETAYVREALVIDPVAGTASEFDLDIDFVPAVLAARADEVFALGTAGEVARFDATTLARVGAQGEARPRGSFFRAVALPNGQLAVLGGQVEGEPVGEIDLFTPAVGD